MIWIIFIHYTYGFEVFFYSYTYVARNRSMTLFFRIDVCNIFTLGGLHTLHTRSTHMKIYLLFYFITEYKAFQIESSRQ